MLVGPFGPIWFNHYAVRLTPFQVKYVEAFQPEPVDFAKLFLTQKCNPNDSHGGGGGGRGGRGGRGGGRGEEGAAWGRCITFMVFHKKFNNIFEKKNLLKLFFSIFEIENYLQIKNR